MTNIIGEWERANLVVQLARISYISVSNVVCMYVFHDFTILRSHTCRKSLQFYAACTCTPRGGFIRFSAAEKSSYFAMTSESSAQPEREMRLATLREQTRSCRASETAEAREQRLATLREQSRSRRASETAEAREQRLATLREQSPWSFNVCLSDVQRRLRVWLF